MYKFYVEKTMEISAAHRLELPYESKCSLFPGHGHNYLCEILIGSDKLNPEGMVVDFTKIKEKIMEPLDHHWLNDVIPGNPTAENMAVWITEQVNSIDPNIHCVKVSIEETRGNRAIYYPEGVNE